MDLFRVKNLKKGGNYFLKRFFRPEALTDKRGAGSSAEVIVIKLYFFIKRDC
jgi:hypothetical protein